MIPVGDPRVSVAGAVLSIDPGTNLAGLKDHAVVIVGGHLLVNPDDMSYVQNIATPVLMLRELDDWLSRYLGPVQR